MSKVKQPANPPPPLFAGKKEKDFVKQVNDEIIENWYIFLGIYKLVILHTTYKGNQKRSSSYFWIIIDNV